MDKLETQFEDLEHLVDRWQRTSDNYNRAIALFAFLAGGAFVLLILEVVRH